MMKYRWWKINFLLIILLIQYCMSITVASPVTEAQASHSEKFYRQCKNDWNVDRNENDISLKNNDTIKKEKITDDYTISVNGSFFNEPMDSAWPMQSHDIRHTGLCQYSTTDNPGTEKWRFKTNIWGLVDASAVIDNDGIIYFGTDSGDSTLYALYPNGTLKWSYENPGLIWSSPAIAEDGTIYVADWAFKLHAMNPDGHRIWVFNAGDPISTSPNIAEDGTIYVGTMDGDLFAVNPDGTEQWRLDLVGSLISSPAIGQDGTIYIGTTSNRFYAVEPNGNLKWQFSASQFKGNPSIGNDGTIYAPCFNGYLYAFYPNGTVKWQASTGEGIAGAGVAIAQDGTIYIGTEMLRAYYPNGTLKWSTSLQDGVYGTVPAVSADGTIYIMDGFSLMAVDSDGNIKWQKQIANYESFSSPCIGEDGTIYVGTSWRNHDGTINWGYLHAFGEAPLSVDAGGPYSGYALESISFMCTTFGGALPYTFLWEFGDGNTSDQENPSHIYARPGVYVATLTLIDGEGNSSSDTANVTVGTSLPTVRIVQPENALYLFGIKLLPWRRPVVIGEITIKVDAFQEDVGIKEVSFYIGSSYKYSDYEAPYEWVWSKKGIGAYDIAVYAESNDGRWGYADIYNVLKIF